MAVHNNVFRGPQSVGQYFNPDFHLPLPLVEIPDRLNPYQKDKVRIYAKMMTCLPAQNVKSLPALQMLRDEPRAATRKIAEASSGSTILSLGIIARVLWGNEDVEAHVTNKKSRESLNLLRFFGIKPCLFSGLAQQEPTDPAGIMARLRRKAATSDDMVYLGQYDNEKNWKSHATWTGPQILQQLPEINLFSTTVGTGGCITGTGVALKSGKPSIRVLGVFNIAGDPVPGPRYYEGFQSSPFPWQQAIDARVEVSSVESYRMSMKLSREGLICGPSSGEALQGLLQYLDDLKKAGTLEELVDDTTGEISCVFTCSDLPYQYLSEYFDRLGAEEFPHIENEILLQCDQTKHDPRWILDSAQALELLVSSTLIMDLRSTCDFRASHILDSVSTPLPGLFEGLAGGDLFSNPQEVSRVWTSMRKWLKEPEVSWLLTEVRYGKKKVLILCYDGFASQLVGSALRYQDVEAFPVRGGFIALYEQIEQIS
ncbi:hypothetical protein COCC4DRAFT_153103 [Bipolaris maydis ATCC 48331]|uniref:Rhodanese domain-containing protein n=1 Tax=Cochliobolus heterostrophus (strain C4 / ATCC 48331 / race T) TaxID=665024 RepID=N4WGS5_COCH4|nr:uncharacterized protein COCC4DRAFT_153103 [Bipolaris maydis ATCC 48331]ENH99473.1 hypothetical protein COCC4DRAFT_153103 [Bipolaris maydis ATCC 48331]